jgi:hypothetical protein
MYRDIECRSSTKSELNRLPTIKKLIIGGTGEKNY